MIHQHLQQFLKNHRGMSLGPSQSQISDKRTKTEKEICPCYCLVSRIGTKQLCNRM